MRACEERDSSPYCRARDVSKYTPPADLIGVALSQERVDHEAHRGQLARRVRHDIRLSPAEPAHVREERALLAPAELPPVDAVAGGPLQDRFVDVRDVLGVPDRLAGGLEMTHEHVEHEERARVAQVRRVVRA